MSIHFCFRFLKFSFTWKFRNSSFAIISVRFSSPRKFSSFCTILWRFLHFETRLFLVTWAVCYRRLIGALSLCDRSVITTECNIGIFLSSWEDRTGSRTRTPRPIRLSSATQQETPRTRASTWSGAMGHADRLLRVVGALLRSRRGGFVCVLFQCQMQSPPPPLEREQVDGAAFILHQTPRAHARTHTHTNALHRVGKAGGGEIWVFFQQRFFRINFVPKIFVCVERVTDPQLAHPLFLALCRNASIPRPWQRHA